MSGKLSLWIVALLLWFATGTVVADVEVRAILGHKAMVVVDGKKHLIAVGGTTPEGVKLIAIEDDRVLLQIKGKLESYPLGGSSGKVKTTYKKPRIPEVRIMANQIGMYQIDGLINGKGTHFLVDTGATLIAMNATHAKKLGVDYKQGQKIMMSTASQVEEGFLVKLRSVSVGDIELYDVDAVVHKNKEFPDRILLGMSFLGRLEMQHSSSQLILRKKY